MSIETIQADMRAFGLEPTTLLHADRFISAFAQLELTQDANCGSVVRLGHKADLPLFFRDQDRGLFVNLPLFDMLDPASHIYIEYIIKTLNHNYREVTVTIDWTSLDSYCSNIKEYHQVKDLHRYISLFDFFYKKIFPNADTIVSFIAPALKIEGRPSLYARPGNVELRAIRTILRYPEELDEICNDIALHINSESFMYRPSTSNDVAIDDHGHTIRQLITNAGMYASDAQSLLSSLKRWTNLYISGLFGGHEIFMRWDYSLHAHAARLAASELGLTFRDEHKVKFGNLEQIYDQMSGKKILIVSPFAEACSYSVHTGSIKKLWKNIAVPDFELFGIRAEISTHPARPHSSWIETFDATCASIDNVVQENRIDLALASAGCYGIPLMDYCVKRHNIPAIYYGNYIHLLFGLKLRDFYSSMQNANAEHWIDPFYTYEQIPRFFDRIDGGRYLGA